MSKKSLTEAKKNRKDEFYTTYKTVDSEIPFYKDYLFGKAVYCNCDDPKKSNIWKWLSQHFADYGLKSLTSTFYSAAGTSIATYMFRDKNGNIRTRHRSLKGNGDFSSDECIQILKRSDVVITNPPWSLAADYIDLIFRHGKKFIILANSNVITEKRITGRVISNELHFGVSIHAGDIEFVVPGDYPLTGTKTRIDENGLRYVSVTSTRWLTNVDHGHHPDKLVLHTAKWNLKNHRRLKTTLKTKFGSDTYLKYDNANAIDVPFTDCIPSDEKGVCGVPITFMDRYNPSQFEILGFRKGEDGKDLKINGIAPYFRLLIRQKRGNIHVNG